MMPLVLRLRYFRCVLAVYDFLRKRKQLGRRQGTFSDEVALTLVKELGIRNYASKEEYFQYSPRGEVAGNDGHEEGLRRV